jgi:ABC-type glycerol-3-phosphate transport system substrate-binding protein
MRTQFIVGLLLTVVALTGAFAAGSQEAAATGAEPVELEFWAWATADKQEIINQALDLFQEGQDEITVNFSAFPSGGYQEKILSAVASDTAPDVSFTKISFGQRFASEGVLVDMNPLGAAEMLDAILPAALAYGQYEGGTYMLPVNADNRFIAYNADIVTEAGYGDWLENDALTWDQLVEVAEAVSTRNDDGSVSRIGFYVGPSWGGGWADFMYTAGGSILNEDNTKANFNNQAGLDALNLVLQLKEYSTTLQDEDAPFYNGQITMIKKGSWDLPRFPREMPETNWGVMPFPTPDGRVDYGAGSLLAGIDIAIYAQSDAPAEGFELVEHFLSDDIQSWFPAEYGQFPVVTTAYETERFQQYKEEFPAFAQAAEWMEYTWPLPLIPEWGQMSDIMNQHVEAAWFGEMTPEEALAGAEQAINDLLAD